MPIAIYTRLSKGDEHETATARQEADARSFAQAKGWEVHDVYRDVDLSAYRNVRRPGYEQMLAAIQARQVDGVLVWKLDRLVRSPAEFERFWATCETSGCTLASVNEPVDTSNELGMVVVRILVAFARLESATMSLRLKSAKESSAKQGQAKHGGPRAFGLTSDWTDLVADEADLIREAARRVLAGASLRSIVLDWTMRGITSTTGRDWSTTALRGLLLQRRLCGQRVHHGVVVADGQWPAILDVADCDQLDVLLTSPDRKTRHRGRTFLLSGILRCRCGTAMRGGVATNGRRRYACPPRPEGCNGTSILADPTDELVADLVCDALDSSALAAAVASRAQGPDHAVTIRDAEGRLGELARLWADGSISREEWLTARSAIEERLDGARRAVGVTDGAVVGWIGRGRALRDGWDGQPLDSLRAVVLGAVDRIVVEPATKGRSVYDPDRVARGVEWRT